jgi:hypothetical protein
MTSFRKLMDYLIKKPALKETCLLTKTIAVLTVVDYFVINRKLYDHLTPVTAFLFPASLLTCILSPSKG